MATAMGSVVMAQAERASGEAAALAVGADLETAAREAASVAQEAASVADAVEATEDDRSSALFAALRLDSKL